ncbi:hypothetical protein Desdi_1337 [Desulfitobacterium dichloroeliminans LMG P-21439]|uniref:Uncharacterized protein n=1 Tax=Desulfitobacterium dichloroeliminans (strain LMG P-21439 / DCA1) TaxID=871963 RepID=L0F6M7_DESDL|nr:hypothetical protein [Desulfitobacterium dichloroeliminans]AGA68847.1 hypothetical protein Desdi_1337 [Desulfitobacterium dichloroeliminans LMG P-21439]UWG96016.1 hypothetical protein LPY66_14000 [Dehalobacter sp. DCM]
MTNREVIAFYKNKNSHYELSDEFVKKYQQPKGGYIEYAIELGLTVNKSLAEPNQRWHLLESYYGQKKEQKKLDLDAKATCWDLKWQNGGFICPELLLWMAEAAGYNISEAMQEAEKLCVDNKRSQAHEKIKKLITWEMIENKIKNS